VKFHVTKAKYIGDEWRATAISSVTVDQIQGAHKTFGNSILTCHSVHSTERGTLFLQGNQA
jgi:cytochrome c556